MVPVTAQGITLCAIICVKTYKSKYYYGTSSTRSNYSFYIHYMAKEQYIVCLHYSMRTLLRLFERKSKRFKERKWE
jgi:hypothetical protein